MGSFLAFLFLHGKVVVATATMVVITGTAVVVASPALQSQLPVSALHDDEDSEPLSSEDAVELLEEWAEACQPAEGTAPPDLSGLTEDQAAELIEALVEACDDDEPLDADDAATLLAFFHAVCGEEVQAPSLEGLTEAGALAAVVAAIDACHPPDAVPLERVRELLLALFRAVCGDDFPAPDLTGLRPEDAVDAIAAAIRDCTEPAPEPDDDTGTGGEDTGTGGDT